MTIHELRAAIKTVQTAIDAAFQVALVLDTPRLGRLSGAYVSELKDELGSLTRALASRVADETVSVD